MSARLRLLDDQPAPSGQESSSAGSDAFGKVPLVLNAARSSSTDGRGERSQADTIRSMPGGADSREDTT